MYHSKKNIERKYEWLCVNSVLLCSKPLPVVPYYPQSKRKVLVLTDTSNDQYSLWLLIPWDRLHDLISGTLSPTPTTYMDCPQLVHEHQAFSHWTAHAAVSLCLKKQRPGYLHGSPLPPPSKPLLKRTSYSGDALCLSHSPLL